MCKYSWYNLLGTAEMFYSVYSLAFSNSAITASFTIGKYLIAINLDYRNM